LEKYHISNEVALEGGDLHYDTIDVKFIVQSDLHKARSENYIRRISSVSGKYVAAAEIAKAVERPSSAKVDATLKRCAKW